MQPLITAKCQQVPLLPVRDELLLGRYFILNAFCLNWSMRLGRLRFSQSVCCPPGWLRELPSCLSAFMGVRRGLPLPLQTLLILSLPTLSVLAKEQSPGSLPGPLPSSQHRRCPQSPGAIAWPYPSPTPAASCIQSQHGPCGLEKKS